MKKQTFILAILCLSIFGLVSCEKEDPSLRNPTLQLKFNTAKSSEAHLSGANLRTASANSIQFTSGHIILENIEFQAESDTELIEVDFEIDGFITIDFATGKMTPDLSTIELVPGNYTEIELEFDLWDQAEQASIDLSGTWTDANGTSHPVRLKMPLDQSFSLEIEGDILIKENTTMVAYVTIDPNIWFMGEAGELLSSATINSEGIIVISPDVNFNIYDIIKDAIDHTSEIEIAIN